MTLGQKIRELRESNGMFQRQLASILEIGDGFLSKVESDHKPLKREHLKTISETFNCSFSELEGLWYCKRRKGRNECFKSCRRTNEIREEIIDEISTI